MIISVANNKGGSGKSTTCANLGAALAQAGRRVLLIDGDMQMNLSLSFFEEEEVLAFSEGIANLLGFLQGEAKAEEVIRSTRLEGLSVIPSTAKMSGLEGWMAGRRGSAQVLTKKLAAIAGEYEVILIDAPPTLGQWTAAILAASDRVIIPVEAAPWGLFGRANLFDFLKNVQKKSAVSVMGVLVTKVDERKNYYRQTMETLADLPDIPVLYAIVRDTIAIRLIPSSSEQLSMPSKSASSCMSSCFFILRLLLGNTTEKLSTPLGTCSTGMS